MNDVRELNELSAIAGVSRDEETGRYQGFVTIRAIGDDGTVLTGQLRPENVRATALSLLEIAEAADQDRLVLVMLTRDLGISEQNAGGFIAAMREEREKIYGEEEGEGTGDEPGTEGEIIAIGDLYPDREIVFVQSDDLPDPEGDGTLPPAG